MEPLATVLLLADSRFPSGAHAHSAGLEALHRMGLITSCDDLAGYLDSRLATVGLTDAAFTAAACAQPARWSAFDRALEARTLSPRQRTVSRSLGRQLLRAARRAWPGLAGHTVTAHPDGPLQPVALGATAWAAGLTPRTAAAVGVHHLVGTATSAAVRLMGLDPFEVQSVAAALAEAMDAIAEQAAAFADADPDMLPASSSVLADLCAEHHATWEVRLFAS